MRLLHDDPAATSHHNQPSFVVYRECRRSEEQHCLSLTPNFDSSASRSSSMTVTVRICNDQPRHYFLKILEEREYSLESDAEAKHAKAMCRWDKPKSAVVVDHSS